MPLPIAWVIIGTVALFTLAIVAGATYEPPLDPAEAWNAKARAIGEQRDREEEERKDLAAWRAYWSLSSSDRERVQDEIRTQGAIKCQQLTRAGGAGC